MLSTRAKRVSNNAFSQQKPRQLAASRIESILSNLNGGCFWHAMKCKNTIKGTYNSVNLWLDGRRLREFCGPQKQFVAKDLLLDHSLRAFREIRALLPRSVSTSWAWSIEWNYRVRIKFYMFETASGNQWSTEEWGWSTKLWVCIQCDSVSAHNVIFWMYVAGSNFSFFCIVFSSTPTKSKCGLVCMTEEKNNK